MKTIKLNNQDRAVGNIFCIGRNYTEHIKELHNATPEEPVVFLKPTSALSLTETPIILPDYSMDVQHECELVVYIDRNAECVKEQEALDYVGGYAVGLDLTARDVQSQCKQKGLPWTKAKGFRTSACVSDFIDSDQVVDIQSQYFGLRVNGQLRQHGYTADMMFTVAHIISYLSRVYGLAAGDLIYTGTPAGVAQLQSGDKLELLWADQIVAQFQVQ
ncbi:fumarylacetoacetate hydrolase family protein [Neisseriaceae bacterium ESL0693]|nr:fumarylacetoacetate hydrolase family protein [Neisseriaceae bacterium ESL0693]